MGLTDSNGKKTRMAIVGKQQGGWIIENYTVSEKEKGTMQMLIIGLKKVAKAGNISRYNMG